MKRRPICLSIAGSDSSAGAGIQADLKTFAALDTYGLSVITAVTAQNTLGVRHVTAINAATVHHQLMALAADFDIQAIKIGMLGTAENIATVADWLASGPAVPVVLDPVLRSSSGQSLLAPDAMDLFTKALLPRATLVTPNLAEAKALTGDPVDSCATMERAGAALLQSGPAAVLVKGGHLDQPDCADLLVTPTAAGLQSRWFRQPRIATRNTHGTGCTLSAAITAYLAHGHALPAAVAEAKTYCSACLDAARHHVIGHGHGPLDHFAHSPASPPNHKPEQRSYS